jgi:hypothetical protein
MSYFNGPANPEDFEDGYEETPTVDRKRKAKINLGIFCVVLGLLGSTLAANISLQSGPKKEFGQGIFQIKACDQWVGIGLDTGDGQLNSFVKDVRIIGLDPRLCRGSIFRINFFPTGSTTALDLFQGAGPLNTVSDSVTAKTLVTRITNSAYTGSTLSQYNTWAYNAVTLIDPQGRDIGYLDDYESIDYNTKTGEYTVIFTYPKMLASAVTRITIETAKY